MATIQKFKQKAIIGTLETTYGTSVALTAANALLTANMEIMPLETETVELEYDRSTKGASPQIMVARKTSVKFDVYAVGSGTVGVAPAWGFLLEACSMIKVETATEITYLPVSDNEKSAYFEINVGQTRHAMLGARGTFVVNITAQEVPKFSFEFWGLYSDPIESAMPTTDYSQFTNPQGALTGQTIDFEIDGFNAPLKSLELDAGNELVHANLIGYEEIILPTRDSKGSISFTAPLLSEFDWTALVQSPDGVGLQITHDNRAGYQVAIAAPAAQFSEPKYSEQDGMLMLDASLRFLPAAGDDDFSIVCS